jgi:hypothetical protein
VVHCAPGYGCPCAGSHQPNDYHMPFVTWALNWRRRLIGGAHTLRHLATHLLEQNIDIRVSRSYSGMPSSTRRRATPTWLCMNLIREVWARWTAHTVGNKNSRSVNDVAGLLWPARLWRLWSRGHVSP